MNDQPSPIDSLLRRSRAWPIMLLLTGLICTPTLASDPEDAPNAVTSISLDASVLAGRPPLEAASREAIAKQMIEMATKGDARSLARLRTIFETYPEWRHVAAKALAHYSEVHRRQPGDWRLLVRSLTVVEQEDARIILQALLRFRERSNKPRWLRQVIVLGLELGDDGRGDAVALLEHWTNQKVGTANASSSEKLAAWQAWYAKTHPDQPDVTLPRLPANATWQYDSVRRFLDSQEGWNGDRERGRVAFTKASCNKCHRVGSDGEMIGPDLSDISGRMQRKEILRAILFPSEVVPDLFMTRSIITVDGRTFTGVVGRGKSNEIVVLQANGEQQMIKKSDVEESVVQKLSAMPTSTLDQLTKQEIADLFSYLARRED